MSDSTTIRNKTFFTRIFQNSSFTFEDLFFECDNVANAPIKVSTRSGSLYSGLNYAGTSQVNAVVTAAGGAFTGTISLPATIGTTGDFAFTQNAGSPGNCSYFIKYVAINNSQKNVFIRRISLGV